MKKEEYEELLEDITLDSNTGEPILSGFVVDGEEYFKNEASLHEVYSEEEYLKMFYGLDPSDSTKNYTVEELDELAENYNGNTYHTDWYVNYNMQAFRRALREWKQEQISKRRKREALTNSIFKKNLHELVSRQRITFRDLCINTGITYQRLNSAQKGITKLSTHERSQLVQYFGITYKDLCTVLLDTEEVRTFSIYKKEETITREAQDLLCIILENKVQFSDHFVKFIISKHEWFVYCWNEEKTVLENLKNFKDYDEHVTFLISKGEQNGN